MNETTTRPAAAPRRSSRQSPAPLDRPAVRRTLRIGGVALAAFAVGYLLTAVLFFGGIRGDDIVTVPDLRGRAEADARRVAQDAGLGVELGPALVNPEVPAGHVLAQSPLPGEEVSAGSVVRLTLSAGPERRPVPDVRALGGELARQMLERVGFTVQLEERPDPAPAGRVLEIAPAPGTPLQLPASVRLVVSSGPPTAEVPDVVGRSEDDARAQLEAAGFRVGEVEYDPFSWQPTGSVTAQAPFGGEWAPLGTAVRLTVAGPRPWEL